MLTCAFIGDQVAADAGDELRIPKALAEAIGALLERDRKFCFYFSGMGWFDRLSANLVRRARRDAPKKRIRLMLVLPYERGIGEGASYDAVIVPEELRTQNPIAAILERNHWLVEHSDCLISYARQPDGAADALRSARSRGLEIIEL